MGASAFHFSLFPGRNHDVEVAILPTTTLWEKNVIRMSPVCTEFQRIFLSFWQLIRWYAMPWGSRIRKSGVRCAGSYCTPGRILSHRLDFLSSLQHCPCRSRKLPSFGDFLQMSNDISIVDRMSSYAWWRQGLRKHRSASEDKTIVAIPVGCHT